MIRKIFITILCITFAVAGAIGYQKIKNILHKNKVLEQVIGRLQADSRVAEVLVSSLNYDEEQKKTFTTIKFLEYDIDGNPLAPKYFTFSGNIIQFQSLIIRFDDIHIRKADKLKGKSAHLFWKVFMLDGENTQEYDIAKVNSIPAGYKLPDQIESYEQQLWKDFWSYALDPQHKSKMGVKNAQIEAPGNMFVPGILYTIKIEHDGGLRIDTSPLSPILRGEKIL